MAVARRTLLNGDAASLADVYCGDPPPGWTEPGPAPVFGLVLVRHGVVRARVEGVEQLMDPTTVFVERLGGEQQFAHPAGADTYTEIVVSEPAVADLLGGDPVIPQGLVFTTPALTLGHRALLAAARHAPDPFAVEERVLALTGRVFSALAPDRVAAGSPATDRARRRLADEAREALAADRTLSLTRLSALLGCSPFHLSRVFRARTGTTLAGHRAHLRTTAALDRLLDGERDLGRLAADLGFSDQAHMTHALRDHTGLAPGRLRALLGGAAAGHDAPAADASGRRATGPRRTPSP
ncbi:helix-turn-helix domain-containing protein [Streptomyces sp. bgisy159]|uniref:helix-turn-helix domain-containing protein n=1 Tax=Streptomyces sp. bgisy159 TaxID=3413795 RepID=UPI003F4A4B91